MSVSRVFEELGEKPRLEAVRLGKKMQSKVRPVKVTLSSSSTVHQILSSCSKLRQSTNYKTACFSPLIAQMKSALNTDNLFCGLKKKLQLSRARNTISKEGRS